MSVASEFKLSGQFINVGDACNLLDQCEEVQRQEEGGLSMHWLRHDTRGAVLLVQGSNGEFVLVQAT